MSKSTEKLFTKALHLSDPWEVFSVNIDDTETRVDIRIRSKGKVEHICPDCGCSCKGYDKRERTWQHMDFFDMECHLHCAVPRMRCPKCGKVMLADVPWAQENSGFTLLFEAKGVELMKEMPVNAAGRYLGVTDKRLWRVLDKHVEERMKHQDLSELDRFYVDETSCRRGHRYVSIFVDEDHNIIFVTNGNDASSVARFREHLEAHGGKASNVKFICCDMGKGFLSGIKNEFPGAVVTYDRYHVMQHMSLAVDRARRHEWNVLREGGRLKDATKLKGQRFVLLRNVENLSPSQKERIDWILESHKEIGIVYGLKESLRDTWDYDSGYDAANHLLDWLITAERTGISALRDIIKVVDNHFSEILNWFRSKMNNGVMEGMNSVIQAVKRRARGYRDWRNLRTMCYLRGSGLC